MAVPLKREDPENLKHRLLDEAEKTLRRSPKPPMSEVIDAIQRNGTFRPADFGAPDSTTLLREERDR